MAKIFNLLEHTEIEDQATGWIAKLDRGLSSEEKLDFQRWLTSNRNHYQIFIEIAEFWDFTDQFNQLGLADVRDIQKVKETESVKPRQWFLPVAACVLLFIGGFFATFFFNDAWQPDKPVYAGEFRSENERIEKRLPDGSLLVLDAESYVQVSFYNTERNIRLNSGNLYIEVEPDKEKPLTVEVAGYFFKAVGTAFTVSVNQESIEMVVTEGSVSYGVVTSQNAKKFSSIAGAGSKVTAVEGNFDRQVLPELELNDHIDWRRGILKFRGEPLQHVLAEFEKYTDMRFNVVSDRLKNEKITGRFRSNDINAFLQVLTDTLDIEVLERDNAIYLIEP